MYRGPVINAFRTYAYEYLLTTMCIGLLANCTLGSTNHIHLPIHLPPLVELPKRVTLLCASSLQLQHPQPKSVSRSSSPFQAKFS